MRHALSTDDRQPGLFELVAARLYAPVASRLRTYDVELDAAAAAYVDALLAHPAVVEYYRAAASEPWIIERAEFDRARVQR